MKIKIGKKAQPEVKPEIEIISATQPGHAETQDAPKGKISLKKMKEAKDVGIEKSRHVSNVAPVQNVKSDSMADIAIELDADGSEPVENKAESGAADLEITIDATEFQHDKQPDAFEEEQVNAFTEAVATLSLALQEKGDVANSLQHCMMTLQEHPEFVEVMRDKDFQMLVRGAREAHGIAITKSTERTTKRSAKQQNVDEVFDMLKDIEINV